MRNYSSVQETIGDNVRMVLGWLKNHPKHIFTDKIKQTKSRALNFVTKDNIKSWIVGYREAMTKTFQEVAKKSSGIKMPLL